MKNAPRAYRTEVICSLLFGKYLRENVCEKITTNNTAKVFNEPFETSPIKLPTVVNPLNNPVVLQAAQDPAINRPSPRPCLPKIKPLVGSTKTF